MCSPSTVILLECSRRRREGEERQDTHWCQQLKGCMYVCIKRGKNAAGRLTAAGMHEPAIHGHCYLFVLADSKAVCARQENSAKDVITVTAATANKPYHGGRRLSRPFSPFGHKAMTRQPRTVRPFQDQLIASCSPKPRTPLQSYFCCLIADEQSCRGTEGGGDASSCVMMVHAHRVVPTSLHSWLTGYHACCLKAKHCQCTRQRQPRRLD